MPGWIGEVIPAVLVWSALLENRVFSEEIVGFEPRDSMFDEERDVRWRRIEVTEADIEGTTRIIPFELEPDPGDWGNFCEACPICLMCTKGYQTNFLPRLMMESSDLLIIYSIEGVDVKKGISKFMKQKLSGVFRRAGLLPLRILVDRCRLISSIFVGPTRVCNCDPRPEPYQFYLQDADKLFQNFQFVNCGPRVTQCLIRVLPTPLTGFWMKEVLTPPSDDYSLLVPVGQFSATFVRIPRFTLTMSFQMMRHGNFTEMFIALSRAELHRLIADLGYHQRRNEVFNDLVVFLQDKLKGVQKFCYKIGTKGQKYRTLDEFHKIDKNK